MKAKTAIIFLLALSTALLAAKPFDYGKVKPEDYKKLKNESIVQDKSGETFKIKNTPTEKGAYIQVIKKKRTKWKRHGPFYYFRKKDGTLKELITYSYGKKEGLREEYTKKGTITLTANYENNHPVGEWTQFNSKGKKTMECFYDDNGKKQGKLREYYNGVLHFEKDYKEGKIHGEVKQYDTETGKLVAITQYKKGKKIGKTRWLK